MSKCSKIIFGFVTNISILNTVQQQIHLVTQIRLVVQIHPIIQIHLVIGPRAAGPQVYPQYSQFL